MAKSWLLYFLSSIPAAMADYDVCGKDNPGHDPKEGEKIKTWWETAKEDWEDLFKNGEFELWDEFDLGKDPQMLAQLTSADYKTVECKDEWPFVLRWDLGYDEKHNEADMFDWDDKMSKKGIVAAMQPPDDRKNWYTTVVYQNFYPFDGEEALSKIFASVKQYFTENPKNILFLKASLGGGAGTSVQWCDSTSGGPKPMYRLRNNQDMNALEKTIRTCVKLIAKNVYQFKQEATAKKEQKWANPASTYGYPGLIIEPGYDFQVEVKAHVVWGKLFGIASETPSKCLHFSNGHDGKFVRFRAFEGDTRGANDNTYKTIWEYVQSKKAVLDDTMLKRIKEIAEGVGKHADIVRVDIFVNTETGAMVVNEIESYWRVCRYYSWMFHAESIKLMARLWVEGWKRLEARGKIKRTKRVVARYQDVAPFGGWNSTAMDGNCSLFMAPVDVEIAASPWQPFLFAGWVTSTIIIGAFAFYGGLQFAPKGRSTVSNVELAG